MPWGGIDDQFFHNRKARAVGVEGRELFVASICYGNLQLNDGCFVAEDVPVIAALAQVEPCIADRLYQQAMWHPEGTDCAKCRAVGQSMPVPAGHIAVHEFLKTNRAREQVLAEREAAAERQRRSREKSRRDSRRDIDGSNGVSSPAPVPDPLETNTQSSTGNSRPDPQPVDGDVPVATWQRYAQLKLERQKPGTVTNETSWKRSTAKNARTEHAETAARWLREYDITPQRLAECLIDGKAPGAQYRRKEPA